MARIVRHNDESCNNRIVIAQRKHLDDFLRGRIIGRLECGRTQLEVSEKLRIAQSGISRLWQRFQDDGTRYHQENTFERHRYGGAGWLAFGEKLFLVPDLNCMFSVTMTGHIYRNVILELHVRLFRGAMGAETTPVLTMQHCRRMPSFGGYYPYSLDLNPIEHVWDMLGRRIAARQPPPTCLPELRSVVLDEWYNIPQDQIDNLKLSMPRRYSDRFNSCQVIYSQFGLAIHQNDHQARRRFVEWAQNEIAVVPDFHKRILFSDEAHFWLNGYVNKQNCRIWSEANPQVNVETPLHPEKLTVWCALWAGGILLQKR
ncbi:transposable element Tcb1 transposase [Trichonephila clavipes]|nr:transposable element Tcb1 transposase [Trichonephila clavipes]